MLTIRVEMPSASKTSIWASRRKIISIKYFVHSRNFLLIHVRVEKILVALTGSSNKLVANCFESEQ